MRKPLPFSRKRERTPWGSSSLARGARGGMGRWRSWLEPLPGTVAALAALGKADGLLGCLEQRLGLVLAFELFGLRITVGDDAGSSLHVDHAVLDEGGAQHNAAIHLAVGGKVADATAVGAALFLFQLIDDLHGAHLGGARERAGGEAGHQRVYHVVLVVERAHHVRDDMHDVTVAFDGKALPDAH